MQVRRSAGASSRRSSDRGALACVLGGMDIVSPLGRAGIPTAVAVPPEAPARWSRYVVDVVDVPGDYPGTAALVEALVPWARAQREPPVLYYPTDGHLVAVSRARGDLDGPFRLVLPDAELVEDLVDKARFSARASAAGLRVPTSVVLHRGSDSPPAVAQLRFPVIVKPVRHAAEVLPGFTGKAVEAGSAAVLAALWERWRDDAVDLLVQELVPGPESCIESYHAYVDGSGVVADFTGRKLVTHPAHFGETAMLVITDDDDVRAAGREAVAALGLHGVCKMDYKRDADGSLWLLEVNPRFNLWHNPGAAAGVDLPALVHADLTGRRRPPVGPVQVGVTWVDPVLLRRALRTQGRSTAAWARAALAATTRSTGQWHDPLPLLGGLILPRLPGTGRVVAAGRRRRQRTA